MFNFVCVFLVRTLKPMILSAFWLFIAWMESTTFLKITKCVVVSVFST